MLIDLCLTYHCITFVQLHTYSHIGWPSWAFCLAVNIAVDITLVAALALTITNSVQTGHKGLVLDSP